MADNQRIEELRRRVQKDPASIAFAQLAEECRRAGQVEEAVEVCRTGLAVHPGYLSARVTLGRALIELNALDEALDELSLVLKSAPENLAAIRGIAEIHHRRGDLADALVQYRSALALARNDPDLQQTVTELARQVEPPPPPAVDDGLSFEQITDEFLKMAPPPAPEPEPEPESPSESVAADAVAFESAAPESSAVEPAALESAVDHAVQEPHAIETDPSVAAGAPTSSADAEPTIGDTDSGLIPEAVASTSVFDVGSTSGSEAGSASVFESVESTSVFAPIEPASARAAVPSAPDTGWLMPDASASPEPITSVVDNPGISWAGAQPTLASSPVASSSTSSVFDPPAAISSVDASPFAPSAGEPAAVASSFDPTAVASVAASPFEPAAAIPTVDASPFEATAASPSGDASSVEAPVAISSLDPTPFASSPFAPPVQPLLEPSASDEATVLPAIDPVAAANVAKAQADRDRGERTIAALEQWLEAIHVARAQRRA